MSVFVFNHFLEKYKNSGFFQKSLNSLSKERSLSIKGLRGSSLSFFTAILYNILKTQIVIIAPESSRAESLYSDLRFLLGDSFIHYYPEAFDGKAAYAHIQFEVKGQRLRAMENLLNRENGILVSTIKAASEKIQSPAQLRGTRIHIQANRETDFDAFMQNLFDFGYERVDLVSGVGEFSVRGGIIDVFPYEEENPVRIEFFGNIVDSVRRFDVITQRSTGRINQMTLLQPDVNGEAHSAGSSLFQYLGEDAVVVLDQPELYEKILSGELSLSGDPFKEILNENNRPELIDLSGIMEDLDGKILVKNCFLSFEEIQQDVKIITHENFKGNIVRLEESIRNHLNKKENGETDIFISLEEDFEIQRFRELFEESSLLTKSIHIQKGFLSDGFFFPEAGLALFTEKDIYGRAPRRKRWGKYRGGTPVRDVNALSVGDAVVHEDFGVGRFLGLARIQVAGNERETLQLEYRDGDKLYVPIDKLQRVKKFTGREGFQPQLNKLGGTDWERIKNRTQKAVEKMARKLIDIYALRKAKTGFSFSPDSLWQKELEASFIYDETQDQLRTIEEIKRDMESLIPMDRLVCGDVGFGKTEVALRAAFKAAMDNKQVAILVPTTVLAQQHYITFRERLQRFPLKIGLLSRFKSQREQKKIVEEVRQGNVDILIGTHRILSKDVEFKDLGLLIIDEEHRFGVAQKERLKERFKLVDVLTLTATPIPRTLHFSIMGARDMSAINTSPLNRLPILTEVMPFDKKLIRYAILNEVHRGGQVFFVHNRVQSIEAVAEMVQRLVPEIRLQVAHGKMHGHELEKVMLAFLNKEFDCLVSTMIIESGLDLPNVNTLIVNRADKFGLAQLYQLRGRVGRSNRQAYAYFLVPPVKYLTDSALQRLRTLEEFVELGSGLKVAMKDLEIRGAGNLLGAQQSGYINVVGFDMYTKFLEETVRKLKREAADESPEEPQTEIETEVDSDFDALIPSNYIPSDILRLNLYQRITRARRDEALPALKEELRDRFGPVPEEVQNLLAMAKLRILAADIGIEKLRIRKGILTAYFSVSV
ncbi:MAG TPA: transcription-repair coupling factor, partial [Bacteroidetes bacterium]|nr:transcription-repair coupling factor [Bacteroidota bacterium]